MVRLPSWVGMVPVRRLYNRFRSVRAVRLPSWVGMVPVRSFEDRFRSVRAVRLPSSAGRLPSMRPLNRLRPGVSSRPVTRWELTVTPLQAVMAPLQVRRCRVERRSALSASLVQ